MRLATRATILSALAMLATVRGAQAQAAPDASGAGVPTGLLVELVERATFDDLAVQLSSGDTPLGAGRAQVARALFAPSIRLPRREREALLLLLVRADARAPDRGELAEALFERVDRIDDWTLLALLFAAGERTRTGTLADGLEVAGRILAALEEPSARGAGYEPAAIAVSRHAGALAAARGRPASLTEPGESGAWTVEAWEAAAFALAETLRSIARLSRSEAVVEAAGASARILLGLEAEER